jgi:hypothetical protein
VGLGWRSAGEGVAMPLDDHWHLRTCADCEHWNPDAGEWTYCDKSDDPAVEAFWLEASTSTDPAPVCASQCPGFSLSEHSTPHFEVM